MIMYNDYNKVRNHLAHFGITGQKKGLRRFQSYQVAPTQSGMVGQEVGEAAKQRARLSKEQKDKIKGAAKQIGKAVLTTAALTHKPTALAADFYNKSQMGKKLDKAYEQWAKSGNSDKPREKMRTDDPNDSSVTRKVKKDYNDLTDEEFKRKYQASKDTYAKRVQKYGDPYMNSPLAKYGKAMAAKKERRQEAYYQHQQKKADYTLAGAKSQSDYRDFYKAAGNWNDNDVDSAIIRNREEALNRLNKASKYRGGYAKAANKTQALANKLAEEYNVSYNDKKGKYSLNFKDPEKKRTSTAKLFGKSYVGGYTMNSDRSKTMADHYSKQSKIVDQKVKQLQKKYNDPTITARDITTSTAGGKYSYVLKDSKKKKYQNG